MKSLRPHISTGWLATGGLLRRSAAPTRVAALGSSTGALRRLHHQAQNETTGPAQGSATSVSSTNSTTPQAPPRRALLCGRVSSHPHVHCMNPLATKSLHLPRRQASYNTKATASEESTSHGVKTGTWQYVVADPSTSTALIIDPVLDYDPTTLAVTTQSPDVLLSLVKDKSYNVDRIVETYAPVDHLTASLHLQRRLAQEQGYKPLIGIGKRIEQVQELFGVLPEDYGGLLTSSLKTMRASALAN
ncbi:hypothetical protein QQZ08_001339 [Neonectria magnoliae]|uniref:Metallo-beta-lactamase domain-containing protein n=1 Tax=Neonectria magnoliae TaxID=2732573 RepID=A0ABR1IGD0_9HYPO